mmetsp:Transcript_42960/g.77661  ORF Transcript_42960/g.77661 Transcript_42960/m.77661 type:complete len:243 (-) Transcript_42960:272-1000(-)
MSGTQNAFCVPRQSWSRAACLLRAFCYGFWCGSELSCPCLGCGFSGSASSALRCGFGFYVDCGSSAHSSGCGCDAQHAPCPGLVPSASPLLFASPLPSPSLLLFPVALLPLSLPTYLSWPLCLPSHCYFASEPSWSFCPPWHLLQASSSSRPSSLCCALTSPSQSCLFSFSSALFPCPPSQLRPLPPPRVRPPSAKPPRAPRPPLCHPHLPPLSPPFSSSSFSSSPSAPSLPWPKNPASLGR